MIKTQTDYLETHSKNLLKTKLNYLGIRSKNLLKTKYIFITALILAVFIICYGLIFTIGINTIVNTENITYIYSLQIISYSIINTTVVIYLIWKLFYDDNNDGVNKLEMRIGLTKQFMYFYRLLLIFLFTVIFLLGEYLLNGIFYGASVARNELFSFRLFISSFSWLAFISFFTIFISLLITIIFKSRFIIIFSAILSVIILLFSSISGNFISNKVNTNYNSFTVERKEQLSSMQGYSLSDNEYVSLGIQFTNLYELYKLLQTDQKYDFLKFIKENYNETLTNDENLIIIINESDKPYHSINETLNKINQANPNDEWYEKISKELINTKDEILLKFGQILQNTKLESNNGKYDIENNDSLKIKFYEYILNSYLYCEHGIELDFIFQYQIKLIDKFNQKMKKSVYLNPLYGLNLMFFGDSSDPVTDNLINRTRPLFRQALNITYNIDYKYNSENEKTILIITQSNCKKTIGPAYYVSVNVLIFIAISCLMYLGYRIKK